MSFSRIDFPEHKLEPGPEYVGTTTKKELAELDRLRFTLSDLRGELITDSILRSRVTNYKYANVVLHRLWGDGYVQKYARFLDHWRYRKFHSRPAGIAWWIWG